MQKEIKEKEKERNKLKKDIQIPKKEKVKEDKITEKQAKEKVEEKPTKIREPKPEKELKNSISKIMQGEDIDVNEKEDESPIEIPKPNNLNELKQLIETTKTLLELRITSQARKSLDIIEQAMKEIKLNKLDKKNIEVEVKLLKLEADLGEEASA